VNVDSVVRTLLSRGLISELYTDSETGAINYGTTELLLEVLGINSLDELPLISPFLPDANSSFDAEL
jgi:segregation and condensation protein B